MRVVTRSARFRGISAVLALLAVVATAPLGLGCGAGASPERDHRGREATVVHEDRVGPRIVDLEIRSPALGTTATVRLLTPRLVPPAWLL